MALGNMNQRKAGVALSYVILAVNTAVNLLYVPLLLYYMGANEYGLYRLMGSVIVYFALLDFGMTSATTRFYTKYRALHKAREMENVLAFASMIYGGIIVISYLAGAFFYWQIPTVFQASLRADEILHAQQIFLLVLLNLTFLFIGNVFQAAIQAQEKFVFLKTVTLLQVVLQPILILLVLQYSPHAVAVVAVQSFCNFLLLTAKIVFSIECLKIRIRYHFWDAELLKEIGSLSMGLFVVAVTDQVFWNGNQIILGMTLGTAAVAVYAVAAQIYMNYLTLSSVFIGVYLPLLTEMTAKAAPKEEFTALFIKIGRLQFFVLAAVLSGFILFGQEFITLWVGESFLDAYWIAIVIMVPFSVNLIQSIALIMMQARNQYGFRAKTHALAGAITIVLAVPAAKYYGALGCACVTGLMNFIEEGLVMNCYFARVLQLDIRAFWRHIGRCMLAVAFCFIGGLFLRKLVLETAFTTFLVKVVSYGLLYLFVIWQFALNAYEKDLLHKGMGKLRRLIAS